MHVMVHKFKKVLVANRGEIAIRIFRALEELGIGSIAVYSKEDRYALFRSKADEAYPLDPDKGPVDAYLDIPTIIRIAKEKKADAIHPGYGFLSEYPAFAEACRKNDIVFIGPTVEAMNIMGDKLSAKQAAHDSNVPIISGSDFILPDAGAAMAEADRIGYPVMLKASNGGGGRGMRIVERKEDMEEAFAKSENESKRAFGESKLFLEKYLIRPKHIEVQILGDNYGNIVHLYDRDCSVQKNNQKVIEFAPAWTISDEIRKKILDSAKRLARRVGYTNAGTMEFLVDEEENPYFIEMNPRIQVEHTVTEMITGIDIVICQILVAEGYPLNSLKPTDRLFPVTKHYLSHEMDRGCKAAGVKRIRIHDLRHSHVSLLIDMGFTALAIGDRVGHESEKITYRYAHLFPSKQTEMADKLNIERIGSETEKGENKVCQ